MRRRAVRGAVARGLGLIVWFGAASLASEYCSSASDCTGTALLVMQGDTTRHQLTSATPDRREPNLQSQDNLHRGARGSDRLLEMYGPAPTSPRSSFVLLALLLTEASLVYGRLQKEFR